MIDPTQAARLRALALVDIVPSVAARWTEAPALTAQAGEGEVLVYGPIVSDLDAAFIQEFLGVEAVTGAAVHVVVDGMAASAASFLLLVGSDVTIAALGTVMIHEMAVSVHAASEQDLTNLLSFVSRKNREMAGLYATRMTLSADEVRTLLTKERFYSAAEAVEVGLADEVIAVQAPAATKTTNETDTAVTALFRRRNLRLAALTES